jgi:hypothetical protein
VLRPCTPRCPNIQGSTCRPSRSRSSSCPTARPRPRAGLEPVADFVRACNEEERRIAAGWASFWHYVGLGRYGEQLQYLFTLFPREQVLVLRYRRLVDEPAQTLDRICAFLGVETGLLTKIPRQNVTSHPESTLAHRAVSLAQRAGSAAHGAPAQ